MAMNFAADIPNLLADFGEQVTVSINGIAVKTITGVLDLDVQMESPYEAGRIIPTPVLTVATADMDQIDGNCTLTARGVIYTLDGKPRNDNHGLTTIFMAVKR